MAAPPSLEIHTGRENLERMQVAFVPVTVIVAGPCRKTNPLFNRPVFLNEEKNPDQKRDVYMETLERLATSGRITKHNTQAVLSSRVTRAVRIVSDVRFPRTAPPVYTGFTSIAFTSIVLTLQLRSGRGRTCRHMPH
eukprot:9346325-Pyramimonas_sp.AAC.1